MGLLIAGAVIAIVSACFGWIMFGVAFNMAKNDNN